MRRQRQLVAEAEDIERQVRHCAALRQANCRSNRAEVEQHNTPPPIAIPETPKSKIKLVTTIIENATPTTSKLLSNEKLEKYRKRSADAAIVSAAASLTQSDKVIKKKLLPQLSSYTNIKAVSESLGVSRKAFYFKSGKGKSPRVSQNTITIIQKFYRQEDVTTTYPNKTKNGKTLRVMKYTRKNTYRMFMDEHPEVKIGLTTFNKLKPRDIKLMKHAKWFQCLCEICDNVKNISRSIRLSFQRSHMEPPVFLTDEMDLAKASVCDINNLSCLDRTCTKCESVDLLPSFEQWINDDDRVKVKYDKWERCEEMVGLKTVTKLKKNCKSGARWQLYQELVNQLKNFPSHIYMAVSQLSAFKKCKQSLSSDEVVVIVDFAENYVCRQFAEAQSAYYARNSVTIHPMVMVFPQSSAVKRDSVVVVGEDTKHDAASVKAFIRVLSAHITIHYPQVTRLVFWSDGCSCQYKSCHPMHNISNSFDTGFHITWNFFGSRHGKGEADGEAAVVKSYLDQSVKSQQLVIHDAKAVFDFLANSDRHIVSTPSRRHFYFVPQSDTNLSRTESAGLTVCKIPRVRSIHQAVGGGGVLKYSRLSCYCHTSCHHDKSVKEFKYPGWYIQHSILFTICYFFSVVDNISSDKYNSVMVAPKTILLNKLLSLAINFYLCSRMLTQTGMAQPG